MAQRLSGRWAIFLTIRLLYSTSTKSTKMPCRTRILHAASRHAWPAARMEYARWARSICVNRHKETAAQRLAEWLFAY
jgi:hypothetical protein